MKADTVISVTSTRNGIHHLLQKSFVWGRMRIHRVVRRQPREGRVQNRINPLNGISEVFGKIPMQLGSCSYEIPIGVDGEIEIRVCLKPPYPIVQCVELYQRRLGPKIPISAFGKGIIMLLLFSQSLRGHSILGKVRPLWSRYYGIGVLI